MNTIAAPAANSTSVQPSPAQLQPPPGLTPLKVGDWIIPGIIAFCAAWYWFRRSQRAKASEAIFSNLDELLASSLEYWSAAATSSNKSKRRTLEAAIKTSVQNAAQAINDFKERFGAKSKNLEELATDLMDACTGGTFEETKRPADPTRCELIGKLINRLKAALRQKQ